MFHLKLLCRHSKAHLLRQLQIRSLPSQTTRAQLFRTSSALRIPSACEIETTSNERKTEIILSALKQSIREQADLVRKLKENGTSEVELKPAIHELLRRKQELLDREREPKPDANLNTFAFDREKFDILVRRRFIFDQSYEIYGGAGGLYDLGPVGCAIKANLLQLWRKFFILEDQMLEIDCPALTIEPVFKASGHTDRFRDYLVKDVKTNENFRVDHLIKSHLQEHVLENPEKKQFCTEMMTKIEGASKEELQEIIQEFNIKSPKTGNDLSQPTEFNLMFDTQFGPSSLTKAFLRPETAQGIFVNFKRLLDYNQGRLPFAAVQIGNAFRNEIAPKSRLLRVREFTMAEIEHFFDPNDKSHPKFQDVANTKVSLYSASNQMNNENAADAVSIGEAVEKGLIANETLGYFLARIQQFLLRVGVTPNYLRFRQHLPSEMAHYAVDCWDAECLTSHGWIECVGCADRSAYDLKQHSNASGFSLTAERKFSSPIEKIVTEIAPTKEYLKKLNNKTAKQVVKFFASLNQPQQDAFLKKINENGFCELSLDEGKTVRVEKASLNVRSVSKMVHVEEITPNVIEPSFGIGRILYAILEHSFRIRDGEGNSYFALPAAVAAHKCSILPLSNKPEFQPLIKRISSDLTDDDVAHKIDDMSGSIGRRYVRTDEIGVPFGITIDFESLKEPSTVTIRERDTKEQLRIPLSDVSQIIRNLCNDKVSWQKLGETYPKFEKNGEKEKKIVG